MSKTIATASVAALLLVGTALPTRAQNCTVSRERVIAEVQSGVSPEELEKKYAGCVAEPPTDSDAVAKVLSSQLVAANPVAVPWVPSESVKDTGSTYWEALKSCGYHPQREEANCVFEVRQRFGFGGPVGFPGSHEYLLFCADLGSGLVPIHTNGVHLNDESLGMWPRWSISATIQSNPRLLSLLNDGRTMRGRVILSWQIPPSSCNAQPIWGNQSDFRFRLDP
jgi:hypothetical protein